jgi:hypothetical protein
MIRGRPTAPSGATRSAFPVSASASSFNRKKTKRVSSFVFDPDGRPAQLHVMADEFKRLSCGVRGLSLVGNARAR